MRMHHHLAGLLILLAECTAAQPSGTFPGPDALEGLWEGEIEISGKGDPSQVRFDGKGSGSFDLAPDFLGIPLSDIRIEDSRIAFQAAKHILRLAFTGQRSGSEIHGEFQGIWSGRFRLLRLPETAPFRADLDAFCGEFRAPKSRFLVRRQGTKLWMDTESTPFQNGLGTHFLIPLSAGECVFVFDGAVHRIDFVPGEDGTVRRLRVEGCDEAERSPLPYSCREVEVKGKRGVLSCTLTLPSSPGPHLAALFVHGSGPHTRAYFGKLSRLYGTQGIASLICDKPGCGDSAGEFREDVRDDAEDAIAAIRWMRESPDLDPDRIGMWGISQAGWIIPLAAVQDPRLAFAVLVATSAGSTAVQDRIRIEHTLKAQGVPEAEVRRALELSDRLKAAAASGKGLETLEGIGPGIEKEAWWKTAYLGVPLAQVFELLKPTQLPYDPTTDLGKMSCRVLVVQGGKDTVCPAEVNRPLYERAFGKTGRATFLEIPDLEHGLPKQDQQLRIIQWMLNPGK